MRASILLIHLIQSMSRMMLARCFVHDAGALASGSLVCIFVRSIACVRHAGSARQHRRHHYVPVLSCKCMLARFSVHDWKMCISLLRCSSTVIILTAFVCDCHGIYLKWLVLLHLQTNFRTVCHFCITGLAVRSPMLSVVLIQR